MVRRSCWQGEGRGAEGERDGCSVAEVRRCLVGKQEGGRADTERGRDARQRKASGNKKEAKRLSRAEFPTNQSREAAKRGPGAAWAEVPIADESDSADAPVNSQSPAVRQTETHNPAL